MMIRWPRLAWTLVALSLGSGVLGCASAPSPSPPAPRAETVTVAAQCFFDATVCAFFVDDTATILAFDAASAWWLTTRPLRGLNQGAGRLLVARKLDEDIDIYRDPTHPFSNTLSECCAGDVKRFLNESADAIHYSESPWQRLSAVGAWARTGGRISPQEWLDADPLIGTAGNGPDIVLPGLRWVGGDVAGSATTRIAIAHDVDWSLGRYLGVGPLAPYLFARRHGGGAPDAYSPALGLAGLGSVICRPQDDVADAPVCTWFEFDATAVGGPYASLLREHPDWTLREGQVADFGKRGREVCVDDECVCVMSHRPAPRGKTEASTAGATLSQIRRERCRRS